MNMSKKTIIIILAIIVAIAIGITRCGEMTFEGNIVEIGEVKVEIPESRWTYDEEYASEESIQLFSKEYGTIEVEESNQPEFSSNTMAFDSTVMFVDDFDEYFPENDETYIDGCRTQFGISEERTYAIVQYSRDKYYFVSYMSQGSCENPEEVGVSILQGISLARPPEKYTNTVLSCEQANELKAEMISDGLREREMANKAYAIQGKVMSVDDNNGATYIDIGEAYPSRDRITGTLWPENKEWFGLDLKKYLGKTIYLIGTPYVYDGVLNIELEFDHQILEVMDIDAL